MMDQPPMDQLMVLTLAKLLDQAQVWCVLIRAQDPMIPLLPRGAVGFPHHHRPHRPLPYRGAGAHDFHRLGRRPAGIGLEAPPLVQQPLPPDPHRRPPTGPHHQGHPGQGQEACQDPRRFAGGRIQQQPPRGVKPPLAAPLDPPAQGGAPVVVAGRHPHRQAPAALHLKETVEPIFLGILIPGTMVALGHWLLLGPPHDPVVIGTDLPSPPGCRRPGTGQGLEPTTRANGEVLEKGPHLPSGQDPAPPGHQGDPDILQVCQVEPTGDPNQGHAHQGQDTAQDRPIRRAKHPGYRSKQVQQEGGEQK